VPKEPRPVGERVIEKADQIENLPLDIRQTLDCPQHQAGIRGEARAATIGRGRNACFLQSRGKGSLV
jgi:hypothetical protein